GNGGYLLHCKLAGRDCSRADSTQPGLYFAYGDSFWAYGSATIGGSFNVYEFLSSGYDLDWGGSAYIWDRDTHFPVVDVLAPVPLPASAALMPLGLAGLAMIRRRRGPAMEVIAR